LASARVPATLAICLPFFSSSFVQGQSQIKDGLASNESLFVVIFDVHVEHVHRSIELAALVVKIFKHGIEATLLTCDDDVGNTGLRALETFVLGVLQTGLSRYPVLKSLWETFDVEVASLLK
jgi:hypothetical protein